MPSLARSLLALAAGAAAAQAFVVPAQQAFSLPDQLGKLTHAAADKAFDVLTDSWDLLQHVATDAVGTQWTTLTHASLPGYALRITEPNLCDPTVKQYSGYIDVLEGDKHFFFWFFESRNKPKTAPLTLWQNGGPGCSSTTGLLFENGPCSIRANGTTVPNPNSWNEESNIIFLDAPIGVGGSYSDSSKVDNTPQMAEDVFAFLTLFLAKYDKYAAAPFHISGESYAGTYIPHIASVIHRESLALNALGDAAPLPAINLQSVLIGNGLSDPLIQFGTGVYDYACDSPQAVFKKDSPECANIAQKAPQCARLIEGCYKTGSRFACVPAGLYCWSQLFGDFQKLGLNPYDVRKKCDKDGEDGPLCYRQMGWIEQYLNQPEIQAELGMRDGLEFKSCNMEINQAFMLKGDGMHHAASLLTPLLADGIRLLVYAGEQDFMCNYVGIYSFIKELDNVFQAEFNANPLVPYVTLGGHKEVGRVQVAGAQAFTAGNLAYVSVHDAGHMVPFDTPDVALDLFSRWIHNVPLVLAKPDNATAAA